MPISQIFKERFSELVNETEEKRKNVLAKYIGVSATTFSNAYNYGILPTCSSLVRIADYFDVSVDYLIGTTDTDKFDKAQHTSTFAQRLEELRREKKIKSIYELSQCVHIHRNNFAQWLNKGYLPVIDDLMILSDFFNVSADYLLGRTDDYSPHGNYNC